MRFFKNLLAASAIAVFLGLPLWATDVSWDLSQEQYTLTWDAVDPSTDTADVSYLVYCDFGVKTATTLVDGSVYGTSYNFKPRTLGMKPYGTYSFVVKSSDSITGLGGTILNQSFHFIHDPERADADGSQVGHDQLWNITASMQADATLYAAVYPAGTTFSANADGLTSTASASPVKVLIDNVARSMEQDDYQITVTWDSRNSSGTIVSNGIYPIWIRAREPVTDQIRGSIIQYVPVDVMRILSFSATSISSTNGSASFVYTLNSDALVTILICKSGTKFTQATAAGSVTYLSGTSTYTYVAKDNVPLNDAGTGIDGEKILKMFRFYRQRGTQTETWNGTDEAGTSLARNIYAYTISARDEFGNFAVESTGNDGPIADTISIDRTAPPTVSTGTSTGGGSTGGGTGGTTADVTAPTVVTLTPANAATITTTLSSVSAVLSDNTGGSGINSASSTIVLTSTSGAILSGSPSYSNGTLTLTLTNPLTRANNGIYTLSVRAFDLSNNFSSTATATFNLNIDDPQVFASDQSVYTYPSPAKNVSSVSVYFNTNRTSAMTLRIFNVLGELIYERAFSSTGGAQNISWDLSNNNGEKVSSGLYIYKLIGESGGQRQEFTKKFVVIQ